ncbi:MAG: DUF3089 domain-containing protein, partial [Alphaproteobacteria bacterium]
MNARHLLAAALALVSSLGAAACSDDASAPASLRPIGYSSPVYADADKWLCRPGLENSPCEQDFDATVVTAAGEQVFEPWVAAEDPAIDCFYVYPT